MCRNFECREDIHYKNQSRPKGVFFKWASEIYKGRPEDGWLPKTIVIVNLLR